MSSPTRLLYVSRGDTSHDRRFLALAIEHGWSTYWLQCDGNRIGRGEVTPAADVIHVDWLGDVEALANANEEMFVAALRQVASSIHPDLIQAGPVPTAGLVAVRARVAPVLVTSWGSDLLADVKDADSRARSVTALRGAARILVDCQTVARAAMTLGADSDRIAVAPWGIDLTAFAYSAPSATPGRLRLLSLRSLEPIYDVATLIRALAYTAHRGRSVVTLSVAGSGSQDLALRALAEDLKVSPLVRWWGRVPEASVADLLRTHDVHVSTALADGSSLSLLQAMAVGRPSIVCDSPSNREWIAPGVSGWMFEPGDVESLAVAIGRASANESLVEMAEQGRSVVEARANWVENGARIARLYGETAGQSSPA